MTRILRVAEVARELGCSERFLREGEKRGKLPKARRDLNGWRVYTQDDLEHILPAHKKTGDPLWTHVVLIDGEHVYHIDISGTNKRIVIRSSISRDGVSADVGQDSIRLSLLYFYKDKWRPLAKLDRWTTRVPGWEKRVTAKLRELYQLALTDSKNHRNGGGTATNFQRVQNTPAPDPRPKLNFGAPTTATPPPPPQQTMT